MIELQARSKSIPDQAIIIEVIKLLIEKMEVTVKLEILNVVKEVRN